MAESGETWEPKTFDVEYVTQISNMMESQGDSITKSKVYFKFETKDDEDLYLDETNANKKELKEQVKQYINSQDYKSKVSTDEKNPSIIESSNFADIVKDSEFFTENKVSNYFFGGVDKDLYSPEDISGMMNNKVFRKIILEKKQDKTINGQKIEYVTKDVIEEAKEAKKAAEAEEEVKLQENLKAQIEAKKAAEAAEAAKKAAEPPKKRWFSFGGKRQSKKRHQKKTKRHQKNRNHRKSRKN